MLNLGIENITIQQMIPDGWKINIERSSVWLSGYRMMRLSKKDFIAGPKIIDLVDSRLMFVYGKINYLNSDAATPRFTNEGNPVLNTANLKTSTEEGAYLIVILRNKNNGVEEDERKIRERISDTIGLVIAFNGRNMAYEHIFDYVVDLAGYEQSVIGRVATVPRGYPLPNISSSQLLRIQNADEKIQSLDIHTQNRIRLSLRWFESAIYDEDKDAFLKSWIALETLAMPDTTNIKPINEHLSTIYNLSIEEARETFHVGRLYNLRSRIVHNGENLAVKVYLLEFIFALYVDLLFSIIGLPSEKRALAIIKSGKFNINKHLFQV